MIGSEIKIIKIETNDYKNVINKISKIKSKENILKIINKTRYGLKIEIKGDDLSIENHLNELSSAGIQFD